MHDSTREKRAARTPSVNHVMISGNLTRDAKVTANGCIVNVAINGYHHNKETGVYTDFVTYRMIFIRNPLAGNISKYLTKGKPVFIEGKLDSWPPKNPGDRATEIITATNVIMLHQPSTFHDHEMKREAGTRDVVVEHMNPATYLEPDEDGGIPF